MVPRTIELPASLSYFLFGPRQTGKSTLVSSTYTDPCLKIDLLKSDVALRYSMHPELLRSEVQKAVQDRGSGVVVMDEIQRVPALLAEVHWLMDNVPGVRFVLTGSSARKLKRGGGDLLGGRAVERHLYPLTVGELGSQFALEDALRFGTLPSIVTRTEREKQEILAAYVSTYLNEEIKNEAVVRNIGAFSRFLEVAAAQSGEVLNASAVARDCQVSQRTVVSYYEILVDTLVGFRLDPWRRSVRKQLAGHPKFYLFDTGVVNAVNRRLSAPPDPIYRGRLFEHLVVCEVLRLLSYRMSEARMYFWRTSTGVEVDLLIEKHGQLIAAAEIKATPTPGSTDCAGLRSLRQEYPDLPCYLACTTDNPYRAGDVEIVPWTVFLDVVRQAV